MADTKRNVYSAKDQKRATDAVSKYGEQVRKAYRVKNKGVSAGLKRQTDAQRLLAESQFMYSDRLIAERQRLAQETQQMHDAYYNQFGDVLNDQALDFLVQHSKIPVPTFTSIMAGYELAKKSRADNRQAQMAATMDAMKTQQAVSALQAQNELAKSKLDYDIAAQQVAAENARLDEQMKMEAGIAGETLDIEKRPVAPRALDGLLGQYWGSNVGQPATSTGAGQATEQGDRWRDTVAGTPAATEVAGAAPALGPSPVPGSAPVVSDGAVPIPGSTLQTPVEPQPFYPDTALQRGIDRMTGPVSDAPISDEAKRLLGGEPAPTSVTPVTPAPISPFVERMLQPDVVLTPEEMQQGQALIDGAKNNGTYESSPLFPFAERMLQPDVILTEEEMQQGRALVDESKNITDTNIDGVPLTTSGIPASINTGPTIDPLAAAEDIAAGGSGAPLEPPVEEPPGTVEAFEVDQSITNPNATSPAVVPTEPEVSLPDMVLEPHISRLGVQPETAKTNMDVFAQIVAEAESNSGQNVTNPNGSAQGDYQFVVADIEPTLNRLERTVGNQPWMDELRQTQDVAGLDPEYQKAMFTAKMLETSGSDAFIQPVLASASPNSPEALEAMWKAYYNVHHTPVSAEEEKKVRANWERAVQNVLA